MKKIKTCYVVTSVKPDFVLAVKKTLGEAKEVVQRLYGVQEWSESIGWYSFKAEWVTVRSSSACRITRVEIEGL